MAPTRRIMVAYIATGGGIDALRLAIALAAGQNLGIDIVIAHTNREVTPGEYPHDRGFETILDRQLASWLNDARAEVPSGIDITTRVAVGDSIPNILIDTAVELGSEMLVVGSQSGGFFKRLTMGSVVNTLLHSCPIPLAIAPRGYSYPGPIDRVTVMFGTRPGATDLIALGLIRASQRNVPLRFVSLNIHEEQPAASDPLEAIERVAGHDLANQARALVDSDAASAEVISGNTIESAAANLEWHPGDVAYMGSSRIAAEGRLFLGSTAAQILRYIPAPTIVIPNGYMAGH